MKLEVLLVILQIGLVLYLIFHQRAIWEELKIHRQILEHCLLDNGPIDDPMGEPCLAQSAPAPVGQSSPFQGFLPQLLLQGLFARNDRSDPTPSHPEPLVEEMEVVVEEAEGVKSQGDESTIAAANNAASTGPNSK
jgi:hypothetical protein